MKYTKFEQARIIGARALQISMGAPFIININEEQLEKIGYNPIEIAKMEFDKDLIPITVKRPEPKSRFKEGPPVVEGPASLVEDSDEREDSE
jgi:DNA-directed RNA polymerase subunit K